MRLNEGEWLFINDMIYKFNSNPVFDDARIQFLSELHLLIPYTAGTFYLADKDDPGKICRPVTDNFPIEWALEYMKSGYDIDYAKWLYTVPDSKAYNPRTWFQESEDITSTPYFKTFSAITHLRYSILLSLAYENDFIGIVCLYKTADQGDFTDKDLFILEAFKKHLSLRIWKEEFCDRASSAESSHTDIEDRLEDLFTRYSLTAREKEILRLLISGMTISEIAGKLSISDNTLRTHSKNIYRKLGINQRSELNRLLYE